MLDGEGLKQPGIDEEYSGTDIHSRKEFKLGYIPEPYPGDKGQDDTSNKVYILIGFQIKRN